MKLEFLLILSIVSSLVAGANSNNAPLLSVNISATKSEKTTADRIREHGYEVETHTVQTKDGYILTLYRIPFAPNSPHLPQRPVMFLQHGLLSSSDAFVLSGPQSSLAFLAANAGYDVWLGNARGNTYSRKHVTKSPLSSTFWNFSWDEIGIYDLPAMIDYVLSTTHEKALHYVGHGQGTTVFMVLLSMQPEYLQKIKTSHMLSPTAYMDNCQSVIFKVATPFLASLEILTLLLGNGEFFPKSTLISSLAAGCAAESSLQSACSNAFFLILGRDSNHTNKTVLPELLQTHPAGASTQQVKHYLQVYESASFRRYNYGMLRNLEKYGQIIPTQYAVENIKPKAPVQFYYSDNDDFAAIEDVERIASRLGSNVEKYHIEYPDWNNIDFLFANNVKEVINEPILIKALDYDIKLLQG